MHPFRIVLQPVVTLAVLSACWSDPIVPAAPADVIQLTQAQAALLVSRVAQFAPTHPDLGALSDTVQFVLKAGAEAHRIDVTTDIGTGPFWAVGLHRAAAGTSQSWSTFHVIAFNEPSNPTNFIILGGWKQNAGATAPTSVTGSFSGPGQDNSVTGHLFVVAGSSLSVWHATAGGSTISASATSEVCPGFAAQGMTCVKSALDASFAMTSTVAGSGSSATGSRTASATIPAAGIPGIRLAFQQP